MLSAVSMDKKVIFLHALVRRKTQLPSGVVWIEKTSTHTSRCFLSVFLSLFFSRITSPRFAKDEGILSQTRLTACHLQHELALKMECFHTACATPVDRLVV